MRFDAEYVLPLRWASNSDEPDLSRYLRELAGWIDVTVVDGSPPELFARHARLWGDLVRHVPPTAELRGRNGKVRGVLTGIATARHERVVIADDDVRYSRRALDAVISGLDDAELVRPQNYFTSLPWHARWDTSRSLINRAWASDYPGTLALRRTALPHGYDSDVLFENLELIRTVRAAGGREYRADDIFVGRRPPTLAHFLSQRVRQAYDDFAQPGRLLAELSLLPLAVWASRRPARGAAVVVAAIALAESGRRRAGGAGWYPPSSALWAPLWLGERAVCIWLACVSRARGGVRYGEGRIRRAATPPRVLRRRVGSEP
jgi:hypothetical protein